MSNDELQKAIDDITKGDAVANATDNTTTDAGTASVPLPDDLTAGSTASDSGLNFSETPDATTGAPEDIFSAPPAPDTSTAMPMGVEESAVNPATEATPSVSEPSEADPMAGLGTEATLDTTVPASAVADTDISGGMPETAPVATAEPVGTEMPTTDVLDEKPVDLGTTASVDLTETAPVPVAKAGNVVDEAMRELYPLLDKVPSMTNKEKYDVCMKVGGDALPKALQYAKGITDETEKAEALLKLLNQQNSK